MKKTILLIAVLLVSSFTFAQKEKELKLNKETNLIEATIYHDNGVISQEGTYNLDGKLEGKWTSYNNKGEKTAIGSYSNGIKTGKWFFWSDNKLSEVDYKESRIVNVKNSITKKSVAFRN